jgi:mannose-6-phosphate isomerase-like protein (cupin superfamily)
MATMLQTQPSQPSQADQIPTRRFDGSTGPRIIGPRDGKFVDLRSVGVRFMICGAESGGEFSLVEHPIPPRTLVAPLHLHEREDEYSYVLEGRMGAQLGDDVVFAEPGRPGVQAAEPVAHVLERGGHDLPDPRDHLARRLRALLQRAG